MSHLIRWWRFLGIALLTFLVFSLITGNFFRSFIATTIFCGVGLLVAYVEQKTGVRRQ